jgi:hypothetical protein
LKDDPDDKLLVRKTIAAVKAIARSVTTEKTLDEPVLMDEVGALPVAKQAVKKSKSALTKKTSSRP